MKTRYRIIARRKIEAARRLRLGSTRREGPGSLPAEGSCEGDPMELSAELVELATEEHLPTKKGR